MGKQVMRISSAIFYFFLLTTVAFSAGADPFSVGGITASKGTRVSGFLNVPPGTDAGSKIPITVIHGATPGPVLALLAGIHGYEYPPITALQSIRSEIDPTVLQGTVILVHVANLPSFLGRTIYYSPVDGKNLNRMFPGNAQGTLSQRIAHQITNKVIDQADYLIDLHSGDGNEALRPYVYMPVTGDAGFDMKIKGLAVAFGLDHIVIDTGPQHAQGHRCLPIKRLWLGGYLLSPRRLGSRAPTTRTGLVLRRLASGTCCAICAWYPVSKFPIPVSPGLPTIR